VLAPRYKLLEEPREQSAAASTDAPYLATIARLGANEKQLEDDVIEFEDESLPEGPTIVDLHSSGEAMSETITEESPIVPTAAPVVCGVYFLKGHIINAIFGLIVGILTFVTLTYFNTTQKCGIYKSTLCWVLIIDAALVQPLTVGFTGLYRWLTADDEESLPSELHPFDGALRPVSS
jgi:tetrahydromethanopterin S-methyltransferase subunit B